MPGASGDASKDQMMRTQWRTELYKAKSKDSKYKDDIKEPGLLSRWPKFMDLQVKLPDPGETVALVEMRKMCPGKPATLEEIEEISQETPFHTPFWKGQKVDTDIPERPLPPAEVDVINRKYLELKAAFDAKRASQSPTESINRAEDRLTAQAAANTGEITSGIRQVQAMQQQILDKLDTVQGSLIFIVFSQAVISMS